MFVALLEGARFPWNPGLVRKRVESSVSRKSFPGVRANFPARDAYAGNLGMLFGTQMCIALAEYSVGNGRSGVRARTGHDDCNHMETLAS